MSSEPPLPRGESCLSDARIDALTHDELTEAEVGVVKTHLAECAACRARCASLTEARDAWRSRTLPPLSAVADARIPSQPAEAKVIPIRRALAWASGSVAAVVAAASLLVAVRTENEPVLTTRIKGDLALRVFLEGSQGARELLASDSVQAGDQLRFAVSGSHDELALVVGIDGTGNAGVYAPSSGFFSAIGGDGVLKGVAQLDAAIGPERFVAIVCTVAPPVDLVLKAARQRTFRELPGDCRYVERQFDKRVTR